MRSIVIGIALVVILGSAAVTADAQSWRPPAETQRCPSKWGAGDERGSANHMKPDPCCGRPADQDRRSHRARSRARSRHAVLRHPPIRRAHQAHVPESALEPARQQRGDRHHRDRPGGYAARRLCPSDAREQPVQLLQAGRHLEPGWLHQAGDREGRRHDHARRDDRRGRAQGRGHAGRQLRDHRPGPRAGAAEAESRSCSPATPSSSTPAGASCGARTTPAT